VKRLERDLHDSVHSELVSLILRLRLAEQDELTPPALAGKLAALGEHAGAVLDALRETIHGLQPIALSRHGVAAALKARADRSPIPVTVSGAVPRSAEESEEAVYFACSEALQNTIKHAGPRAKLTLSLRHEHRALIVQAQDDGCGFDLAHPRAGTGLRNITDRIQARGGAVELSSVPGRGTLLVISVPWPPQPDMKSAQSGQHRPHPTPARQEGQTT
jgi:signal transduction histidine kinase